MAKKTSKTTSKAVKKVTTRKASPKKATPKKTTPKKAVTKRTKTSGNRTVSAEGIRGLSAKTGAPDRNRMTAAKQIERVNRITTASNGRTAGMMMDGISYNSWSTPSLTSYKTSYASGRDWSSGARDIPVYFVMMNEQNGGNLYWPVSLREKYEWYRYWARTDAYVGRAMDLMTDLPMSKISLNMPVLEGREELGADIKRFFEDMCDRLNLFESLQSILWENNLMGNCFPADHRVQTEHGMLPIEQVRKGDLVLTHNGRMMPVVSTMRRRVRENLVEIEIDRAKSHCIRPTKEHPILVLRGTKEVFVEAKDLVVGDYVSMARRSDVVDCESVDVIAETMGLIGPKYDSVVWDSPKMTISYSTRTGVRQSVKDVTDSLLGWISSLDRDVVMDCKELAKVIGITNVSRLRTAVYRLRKKGVIRVERTSHGKKGGSAFRWFKQQPCISGDDFGARNWTKAFYPKVRTIDVNNDFMYLLGYWLGDGWLWKNHHKTSSYISFDVVVDKDSETVEHVESVMDFVFGDSWDSVPIIEDGNLHYVVNDPIFCEWWAHNFGDSSETKMIPQWVENLPSEKLIWLLRGLIDSDGSVSKTKTGICCSISMTNESVIESAFRCGLYCGIPFSKYYKKGKPLIVMGRPTCGKPQWCLQLSEPNRVQHLTLGCVKHMDGEYASSTPVGYRENNDSLFYRVCDIRDSFYDGFVYNIAVDGDNSYCVENINVHNCYPFVEWDEKSKSWSRIVLLPPEEVTIFQYPFSDNARVEYRPEHIMKIVQSASLDGGVMDDFTKDIVENIPKDVVKMMRESDCIVFDSIPMQDDSPGSFVHHFRRGRCPYMDLSPSVLERVLVPMLMREHFKYTQLGVSSRNMTPKNVISAEGLAPEELDDLREQVDLSYLDPEFSIVTNYAVEWNQIGTDQRLLNLTDEYEQIENQVFAALGVTRELLTGEGSWSGNKVTIEILNSMFLQVRQNLQEFVEKKLFRPVCEAHGWFDIDKNGIKTYHHPKLGFNRLSIRDNHEMFDSLYQLYSKGSLSIDVIYDLLNLNSDEIHEKIKEELFTVKDATFNRMVEGINSNLAEKITEGTDIAKNVADYLGLDYKNQDEGGGDEFGGEGGGFDDLGGGFGNEPEPGGGTEDGAVDEVDVKAEQIADQLESGASDEDIMKAIEETEPVEEE